MIPSTCAVNILPVGVIVIELGIVKELIVEVFVEVFVEVITGTGESIVLVEQEAELLTAQLFSSGRHIIHST